MDGICQKLLYAKNSLPCIPVASYFVYNIGKIQPFVVSYTFVCCSEGEGGLLYVFQSSIEIPYVALLMST